MSSYKYTVVLEQSDRFDQPTFDELASFSSPEDAFQYIDGVLAGREGYNCELSFWSLSHNLFVRVGRN